jgi:hypothetical protein
MSDQKGDDSMNDKLHIADTDLALYAMGALSAEMREAVEAHLLICARCKEEVRQNTLALAAYAQTTPEVELPAAPKGGSWPGSNHSADPAPAAQQGPAPAKAAPPRSRPSPGSTFWVRGGRWSPGAGRRSLALLLLGVGRSHDKRGRLQLIPLQAQRGRSTPRNWPS